ncbi:MAG: HDOD domain-containing protein [Phycisphaerales bacterium]
MYPISNQEIKVLDSRGGILRLRLRSRESYMSQASLEKILNCPNLPSLPAIAVRILELTSDPDVSMSDIAREVQQDQALAAKVLKTVNSSFYGLSSPCSSIDRAMGYLGLNTVKSLVLGFCLVDTTSQISDGFDLEQHWRRALIGATGARLVAKTMGGFDPEEAFTASLFQDLGMLAMFMSLKSDYGGAIAGVPHRSLCKQERDVFGFDHATVGTELARMWKLPPEIRESIEYHHNPEECKSENKQLVRLVAIGSRICDCLDPEAPSSAIRTLERLANQWFRLSNDKVCPLLDEVRDTAKMLAKFFSQDIGEMPGTDELMAKAQEKGLEHQLSMQREADELAREAMVDGLTQIANRKRFNAELKRVYGSYVSDKVPFGIIFFDADRFKGVNDTYGHAAGDAVLIEIAKRASDAVGDRGVVFRYGGEEFAVIVEGLDLSACGEIAERIRASFDSKDFDLSGVDGAPDSLHVTASIGVSSTDAASDSRLSSGEQVVHEADECVYAAKSDGRNNVKVFGRFSQLTLNQGDVKSVQVNKGTGTVGTKGPRILLVEDDALAATLVISLLKRRGKVEVEWVKTGTRACSIIEAGELKGDRHPCLILCDFNLPGCNGHEVLRVAKCSEDTREVPFFMLTGTNDSHMKDESFRRGASQFIHKDQFCSDINRWLNEVIGNSSCAA